MKTSRKLRVFGLVLVAIAVLMTATPAFSYVRFGVGTWDYPYGYYGGYDPYYYSPYYYPYYGYYSYPRPYYYGYGPGLGFSFRIR